MRNYFWAGLWATFVLVLCCIPMNEAEKVPKFEGMDKLVHTGFFFVFTVLLYNGSMRSHSMAWPKIAFTSIKVILTSLFLAVLTEFLQWKFFTYRTGDLWDLFADSVGTSMGVFAFILLHPRQKV